jgi:O-antigen/teichoic acid export membrane protein
MAMKSGVHSLAKGTVFGFIGQGSLIFFTFIFQFLIARFYGAKDLGSIAIALSMLSLINIIAVFGMNIMVLKEVSVAISSNSFPYGHDVVVRGLKLVAVISLCVGFSVYIFANTIAMEVYDNPQITALIKVLAFSIPCTAFMLFFTNAIQALGYLKYRVAVEFLFIPVLKILGLIGIFIWLGNDVIGVSLAITFASICGLILAVMVFRIVNPFGILQFFHQPSILTYNKLFFFAVPIIFTDIIYRSLQEAQVLILGLLAPMEQVGVYYVAVRTSALLTVFLSVSSLVFAPIISGLYTTGKQAELNLGLKIITRWVFTLAMPVFVVIFTLSTPILGLFGYEYQAGSIILKLLSISALFNVATGSLGWVLIMTDRAKVNLLFAFLSLLINVALIFLLVPLVGINGAAIANLGSILFVNMAVMIVVYVTVGIHPFSKSWIKPILAGIVGLVTINITTLPVNIHATFSLLIHSILGLVIYTFVLVLLGFGSQDREIINMGIKKIKHLIN